MAAHPIVYVDIPARDSAATAQFYAQVFDWQIDAQWPGYPMFQMEGGLSGGFVTAGSSTMAYQYTPGEVIVYLGTDDIDASLARVEAHGGKTIVPRTEIPQIGFWALFEDPAGNRIGLFNRTQPAS